MDVRGIEVTNQLRSAIRAKLLELGVRYDEELPDYILVMVVNKKSRQQMHEDLHLFLEDSTLPFVEWLHDQVLKKLQKVTVAKKKPREFVPTIVVKQEEERKKKKADDLKVKDEPNDQKDEKNDTIEQPLQLDVKNDQIGPKSTPNDPECEQETIEALNDDHLQVDLHTKPSAPDNEPKFPNIDDSTSSSWSERASESHSSAKRPRDKSIEVGDKPGIKIIATEQHNLMIRQLPDDDGADRKIKSAINKPRITSVVSVKTRLGLTSSRNKFEVYRERADAEERRKRDEEHRKHTEEHRRHDEEHKKGLDRRPERRLYEPVARRDQFRGKSNEDSSKRLKEDPKSRSSSSGIEHKSKKDDSNEKSGIFGAKNRIDGYGGTIKDRLGVINRPKSKEVAEESQRNVKTRLGPVKSKFIALGRLGIGPGASKLRGMEHKNDGFKAADANDDDEEDEEVNTGPVKSHIIAINNDRINRHERNDKNERNEHSSGRVAKNVGKSDDKDGNDNDDDDEEEADGKAIASKVIVTPRPLKPLQPVQKRATQSLLLRAVAEANQSVVRQKNPEPSLLDKKSALKRLKPATVRSPPNKNLAVRLNAKKRLVMENIKVELMTSEPPEPVPEPYVPQLPSEADDHMGVVMSLFQRGDDNQKFLVTLNGYNNNIAKDKHFSDDEERLEMEVNEDDQLALSNSRNDSFNFSEESPDSLSDEVRNRSKNKSLENNENLCIDNITITDNDEMPRKRRKLSPIIYTRSPSPEKSKDSHVSSVSSTDKKSATSSMIINADKTAEKCRYWPNCTLGAKCAYFHPAVACSAFPACKFGDKCAYKHPKCKFGLSCTKLGCIFSHPSQQCKYHPFCTKPGCTYLHPQIAPVVPPETSRSKFTWRRRD